MKTSQYKIILIVVLVWALLPVRAQHFVNIPLSGAQTVYGIAQDGNGLMWIGTENGPYCYDGYHDYRALSDYSKAQTRINALYVASDTLFMASGQGVLALSVLQGNQLQLSAAGQSTAAGEQRVLDDRHPMTSFPSDVYALLHTPKGLLVGAADGLRLMSGQGAKAHSRQVALPQGRQPLVNALAYDIHRKCYWIGTEGALFRADLSLRQFQRVKALDGNSVKCMALAPNGTLFIGTDNGLYAHHTDGHTEHFIHNSLEPYSLPNNIVWACFIDRWNNVWVGTDNGLSRLVSASYYQYRPLSDITRSGEGNCLHALLHDSMGAWWMGGTNGLVRTLSAQDEPVWYRQNNVLFPMTHNRVRRVFEDSQHAIWIATDHGFNLYDPASKQMRNIIVMDASGRYSTTWAYDIVDDGQGRLWMGSYAGGVFIVDRKRLLDALHAAAEGTTAVCVADVHLADHGPRALSGLHVTQLVPDGKGHIWVATYQGLDRIDIRTLRVDHYGKRAFVDYFVSDGKGHVWSAQNTTVVCRNADGREVHRWNLVSKVNGMCVVGDGMWVVCDRGYTVLSLSGTSNYFHTPMRFLPLVAYYDSVRRCVMMAGNDGLVDVSVARPDFHAGSNGAANGETQLLTLTHVRVAGEELSFRSLMPHDGGLTLNSRQNNFTLQLTDLPYANRPSPVYAYRLDGADHDWRLLEDGDICITYNALPHGNYRLSVRVVDGEGHVGKEVYRLAVTVLPPWYMTWWMKMVYLAILLSLAVWAMNFYMMRKRLAEERHQKAEVLEQMQARVSFFARLSERLHLAVEHRSFDEVMWLVRTSLDGETDLPSPAEAPSAAPQEDSPEPTEKATLSEADGRLLREVRQIVEDHIGDSDFNVSTLQELIGVGGKQLYRKVKTLTGQTPVELIRDVRMRKAASLLREGKFSVSEVMYSVGFSNSSYFSKCFSKAFGMTPTEFMKVDNER